MSMQQDDFKENSKQPKPGKFATTIAAKSLTKQCFKDETNINNIMSKYEKTGMIQNINEHNAQYGDFSEINDFQESLNLIHSAQTMFDQLPADVRRKFGNDPVEFVEFTQNPENIQAMIDMGLAIDTTPPNEETPPKQTPDKEKTTKTDEKPKDEA